MQMQEGRKGRNYRARWRSLRDEARTNHRWDRLGLPAAGSTILFIRIWRQTHPEKVRCRKNVASQFVTFTFIINPGTRISMYRNGSLTSMAPVLPSEVKESASCRCFF